MDNQLYKIYNWQSATLDVTSHRDQYHHCVTMPVPTCNANQLVNIHSHMEKTTEW